MVSIQFSQENKIGIQKEKGFSTNKMNSVQKNSEFCKSHLNLFG